MQLLLDFPDLAATRTTPMSRFNTPLRYPGGKQKLTPFVLEVLEANDLVGGEYAEPYAGGSGVAIELLLTKKVSHIHLNDASRAVFAFWRTILDEPKEFCRRITGASVTIDERERQREILARPNEFENLDLGFALFFLNRCNRSGIPSGGVIGGRKQTGKWKIDARFPRNELIRRIEAISLRRKSISVRNWDAERFIKNYLCNLPEQSLVYCDPPYFHKAERLYLNHYKPADHERISKVIQDELKVPWLVSYDDAPEILGHYSDRRTFLYDLHHHANRAKAGREAFFFSDGLTLPESSKLKSIDAALKAMEH